MFTGPQVVSIHAEEFAFQTEAAGRLRAPAGRRENDLALSPLYPLLSQSRQSFHRCCKCLRKQDAESQETLLLCGNQMHFDETFRVFGDLMVTTIKLSMGLQGPERTRVRIKILMTTTALQVMFVPRVIGINHNFLINLVL